MTRTKKICAFIALSAYFLVGMGVDSLLAMCIEQNGDVLIERVDHAVAGDYGTPNEEFEVVVVDSGKPFPLDSTEGFHRDLQLTKDGSLNFQVSLGDLTPITGVVLYYLTTSPPERSHQKRNIEFGDSLAEPAFTLKVKKITVLQV